MRDSEASDDKREAISDGLCFIALEQQRTNRTEYLTAFFPLLYSFAAKPIYRRYIQLPFFSLSLFIRDFPSISFFLFIIAAASILDRGLLSESRSDAQLNE